MFRQQDWKNYVIVVHGMKGSFKNIGAMDISEEAKALEFAGKEERIDYILEKHREYMDKYYAFYEKLGVCLGISREMKAEENKEPNGLLELEEEAFNKKIEELEEVMYTFDEAALLKSMEELKGYQYRGIGLEPIVSRAMRKVEMSDYISAVEMVANLRN